MKESTKYLKSIIENWQEWKKHHKRLTEEIINTLDYVSYLEAENEALRNIARMAFKYEIGKGDKK